MQDTATQAPHPRCSLSSICLPHSKARIPQFLIIPRHQPFISAFTTTWPSYWRSGKISTICQMFLKTEPPHLRCSTSSPLYLSSHLPVHPSFFSLPPVYPPLRPPSFLPLSPLQCNSLPCHSSRRLTPALHNTQTKRKASPCIVCSSTGEIPAAKNDG